MEDKDQGLLPVWWSTVGRRAVPSLRPILRDMEVIVCRTVLFAEGIGSMMMTNSGIVHIAIASNVSRRSASYRHGHHSAPMIFTAEILGASSRAVYTTGTEELANDSMPRVRLVPIYLEAPRQSICVPLSSSETSMTRALAYLLMLLIWAIVAALAAF